MKGDEDNDLETQLAILVENAPVALAMFDEHMRYLVANRFWVEEFGLQHAQPLVGRSQYEIFPGLHPGWRQVYDRALQGHVVRSEHDAISGHDGKAIVYRWEVRPWRKRRDASVGGLMVICEKVLSGASFGSEKDRRGEESDSTVEPVAADECFGTPFPILILDERGLILRANEPAVSISHARCIHEGESHFADAFGDDTGRALLGEQVSDVLSRLSEGRSGSLSFLSIATRTPAKPKEGEERACGPAIRWTMARSEGTVGKVRFVAIAMPGASPFDVQTGDSALPVSNAGSPSAMGDDGVQSDNREVLAGVEEELRRARQEIAVLREAGTAFTKRENRQRAVLEALPCGLIVLDERGMPIYQNELTARMFGRSLHRGETVEQWLAHACPTEALREKVADIWTQDVWSRQLTRTMSLANAEGLIKEWELRPAALSGGGVLVSIRDVTDQCRTEDLLQATEARSRVMMQDCPVGVLLADKTGAVFDANAVAESMTGRSKAELRRLSIDDWLSPDSVVARRDAIARMKQEGRHTASLDVQIVPAGISSSSHFAQLRMASLTDPDGQVQGAVYFLRELPRPMAEGRTGDSRLQPQPVSEHEASPEDAVCWLLQTDQNGRIVGWSEDARRVFGYDSGEKTGSWLHALFRPSDPTGFYASVRDRLALPEQAVEWAFISKGGSRGTGRFFLKEAEEGGFAVDLFERRVVPALRPVESSDHGTRSHLVKPSLLWPMMDLDREKLLLSETHHRIKNHLQIISSMLNLQLNSMVDRSARSALRSSQNRVRSIAALHQHLYQLALGEGPGFEEFARGLAQRLRECYEVPEKQVTLQIDVAAGHLQQEWMMPLALILNETLSNAFEHAFPNGRLGCVRVSLSLAGGTGEFEVCDDGAGLPEGFDPALAPGLGLKILGVFADQMKGELRLSAGPNGGSKFNLRFPMAHVDN